MKKTSNKLNPKQELFVAEYLKDFNATRSAIAAGYKPKRADQTGSRMLRMVKVKAAVNKAKKERLERIQVDADWTLKRLYEEATADLADLFDKEGSVKPVAEWPLIWRQGLVTHIDTATVVGVTTHRLRFSDRIRRIELIGKHIDVSAFQENINHSGGLDIGNKTKDDLLNEIKELLRGGG